TGDMPATKRRTRRPLVRGIQLGLSIAVVVAIFVLIIPKIASYSSVWKVITELTWLEMTSLVVATIFNLFTYWWQMQAAMPGLALLIGSIVLFGMVLWKKEAARAIGEKIGWAWSWILRRFRKQPVTTWGEGAVRFRKQTITLVAKRWPALTLITVVSHLALWF